MIEQVRSYYLTKMRSALMSLSSQGREVYSEICLELPRLETHRQLYRLYVVDIFERLPNGETKLADVNVDPLSVAASDLAVDAPIAWNGIKFRCASKNFPEEALASWGMRWISDDAPPLGPQDEFAGIIHSVSEPAVCDFQVEFSVDFGSAPIAAFDELVALLGGHLRSLGSCSLVADETELGERP